MESKFVIEALKIALIASIKEQMPEEGFSFKVCDTLFSHLHRIDIRGIGVIFICEHYVEELKEFFIKREQSAFDDVFQNQIKFLLGQGSESNHIEEDFDDWGSYYDHSRYAVDHE